MNSENTPITEFDLSLIADFFRRLDRQGPGGVGETRHALSFIPDTAGLRFADIGCGTGGQTAIVASHRDCTITAVDLLPEMIEELAIRMKKAGLAHKVTGVVASMDDLPFEPEAFDIIWCEGAIYNVGFEEGLRLWRRFLKPGGWIVVSDCSWLSEARPADMRFTEENFPDIAEIPEKLRVLENAGYAPVAHFVLPEYGWTDNYYTPMLAAIPEFLKRHGDSLQTRKFAEMAKEEVDYYRQNKAFYSYVFYIGQRIG